MGHEAQLEWKVNKLDYRRGDKPIWRFALELFHNLKQGKHKHLILIFSSCLLHAYMLLATFHVDYNGCNYDFTPKMARKVSVGEKRLFSYLLLDKTDQQACCILS